MRIITLLILFILTAQFVTAQNKVSGKIVDAQNRLLLLVLPLPIKPVCLK
jgi:hypothetical protein